MKEKTKLIFMAISLFILIIIIILMMFLVSSPSVSTDKLQQEIQTSADTDSSDNNMDSNVSISQNSNILADTKKYRPSEYITNSNIDNGSFQVGPYLFTLPTKLGSLMDHGVEVLQIGELPKGQGLNKTIDSSTPTSVLLKYDDIYFTGILFDRRGSHTNIALRDGILVCVEENLLDDDCAENKDHIYLPGGFCIGSYTDNIISYFGIYDQHKEATPPLIYLESFLYGEKGSYSINKSNYISFSSNVKTGCLESVKIYKNIYPDETIQ